MLHTNNSIIKHKAGLPNLVEELGNVSKACKIMGVSRDTFYRYQELAQDGNLDALINRSRRTPNIKNRVDDATENAAIDYAIAEPAHGQHRTSNELLLSDSVAIIENALKFNVTTSLKVIDNAFHDHYLYVGLFSFFKPKAR